ncbi:SH3 domain-binding protein 5-like isoform X3 [Penaeus japonicus]|uniref:SH3 domain-binding protein 5-like isoform X3 n=1 Tax=Penaeus japonicus TaxID=27405 RepID=UPI001C717952|nr:SH3 domain-binding protein 5-like isoform X3 [Penaeus japonicus]
MGTLEDKREPSMEEVDLNESSVRCANSDTLPADVFDEAPDPRIQVELECLNTSTDTINKLEVDLDEARMQFRQLLADSTQRIDALAKRLGKCVEQSRPYYDARIRAKQALRETQVAAVRYERAMSQHAAAREMVFLAEEGLMQKGCVFDHTWQEMLNHATCKVNDAEKEKLESAADHRRTSALYHEAETRVKTLQKELKRAIAKSSLNARRSLLQMNNLARMHQLQLLPYFELKAAINQQLEAQKQRVKQLEESVARAKLTYSQALSNLETISDEIHRTRKSQLDLGIRGVGVGAESPLPPLQAIDGGVPLAAHPLHYAESSPEAEADTNEEYKALPGKLGPAAAPMSMAQVIGLGSPALSPAQYLTVEDRDSIISDTESLASIEMLSDEAIAGLMLDEELAEASNSMCTPMNTPVVEGNLPASSSIHTWPSLLQNFVNPSQQPSEPVTSAAPSAESQEEKEEEKEEEEEEENKSNCASVSQSMKRLTLESSLQTGARQIRPPHTLDICRQSSSDNSSPEDLTPGYAPLRDTPYSPEDFPPLSHEYSTQPSEGTSSPPSTSTSDEGREEPHQSSWVMENAPSDQESVQLIKK